jgi:outer membrane receptor protein involved in Fe transport
MRSHRIRLGLFASALFILALCMSTVVLNAQTYTEGAIAGTVFDSTGAVVPGAAVSIVNNGTNAETSLKSDASGYFKAPLLPPGNYTVTVTAPGFETFKEVHAIVVVNETTEINPHMVTGAATTNVEVTGEAPVLNFESPEISATLSTHNIQDLPLNGGRWSDMTLLTPGAVGDGNGFGLIAFRGISPILNNVEIDGADDNQAYYSEERGRTREGYSTSKYMVDEFTVNTGVYSAEYGRAAGGVINAITKSGGNTMHGIAYFSDRDNDWGTVNPFTTNTVNTGTSTSPVFVTSPYKPVDWRKEWGFDAGGSLKKDKLFWFYGFAQYDRNFPGTAKAANPSAFFTLPDAAAPSGSTCNTTGSNAGYMSGLTYSTSSTQYSVDEQACTLAARLEANGINVPGVGVPSSYANGASAYNSMLVNLLGDLGKVPRRGYEELNTPKLDWQVNEKNHVSVLFHRLRWDSPGGVQTQATNTYAIDSFGMDYVKVDYGLAKLDSQITTNISNEVRYQFGRELNDEGQQPLSSFSKQYLSGFNGATAAGGGLSPNVVQVSLDSPSSTGFYLGSEYYDYRKALPDEHKWQLGDTAAWIHGNHDFKFGIDLVHNYDIMNNTYEGNGYYTYSYIGNFFADIYNESFAKANGEGICNLTSTVSAPGSSTTNYTGLAPCGTMVQGFGPPAWSINTMDMGYFAEDHWKVTPRLTFDLGLRYDYEGLPAPYSNLITSSSVTAGTTTSYFYPYLGSTTNGICGTTNFTYTSPGTCPALAANANLANHPSDKTNFGPRVGIAYDPFGSGRTTVRIGYGLYFGRITNGVLLNNLLNTGSFTGQFVSSTVKPNTFNPPTGTVSASNPYTPLFPNILSSAVGSGPTSYFFSAGFRNPEIHEFDAAVQQEVGRGTIFQLSYMGALSRELPNALNINLNPNACTNCGTGSTSSPNGVNTAVVYIYDSTGTGPVPSGTTYNVPVYNGLINPNFGAVNELMSNINASYNAMVAEIENKTSKLIQFDVNYTWSHALDFDQNETTTSLSSGWFDPYNIDGYYKGANYGNSAFNVGNRVVAWGLLNSPTVNTSNQFLKQVANDWSFNPVFQGQNGLPYSATIGSGYPSYSAYGSSWNGAGGNYWIPYIGRNTYDQPRTLVLDMRLEKQFTIPVQDKPYHLQLMGEMFNVANHPNITGVNTSAYTSSSNSGVTKTCSIPTGGTIGAPSGQGQIECSVMSFQPRVANAGTIGNFNNQGGFGAATSANSNFAYSVRQVMLSLRLEW